MINGFWRLWNFEMSGRAPICFRSKHSIYYFLFLPSRVAALICLARCCCCCCSLLNFLQYQSLKSHWLTPFFFNYKALKLGKVRSGADAAAAAAARTITYSAMHANWNISFFSPSVPFILCRGDFNASCLMPKETWLQKSPYAFLNHNPRCTFIKEVLSNGSNNIERAWTWILKKDHHGA